MANSSRPFDNYFEDDDDSDDDLYEEMDTRLTQPSTRETTPGSGSESMDYEEQPTYSGWQPVDADNSQESSIESSRSPTPRRMEDSSDDETIADSTVDEPTDQEEYSPPPSTPGSSIDREIDYGEDLERRILEWHPTIPPEFVFFFQTEAIRLGQELQKQYQSSSPRSSS